MSIVKGAVRGTEINKRTLTELRRIVREMIQLSCSKIIIQLPLFSALDRATKRMKDSHELKEG